MVKKEIANAIHNCHSFDEILKLISFGNMISNNNSVDHIEENENILLTVNEYVHLQIV